VGDQGAADPLSLTGGRYRERAEYEDRHQSIRGVHPPSGEAQVTDDIAVDLRHEPSTVAALVESGLQALHLRFVPEGGREHGLHGGRVSGALIADHGHDGGMSPSPQDDYDAALQRGRAIYPGVRIGRPGRARTYWATITAMRALRLRWAIHPTGSELVAPGGAILVGNHVSAMDPVAAVMSHWWRVTAFTKVEVFERRGAIFFRLMGQIPLRRGDEESTRWALDMAARTLADGGKLGLYPEGTRSPDKRSLHRLHKRILIPILQASPDTPVHTIATIYRGSRHGRRQVDIRLSAPLPIDARTMDPDEIVTIIRDSLLADGGMDYVDAYARDIKGARG